MLDKRMERFTDWALESRTTFKSNRMTKYDSWYLFSFSVPLISILVTATVVLLILDWSSYVFHSSLENNQAIASASFSFHSIPDSSLFRRHQAICKHLKMLLRRIRARHRMSWHPRVIIAVFPCMKLGPAVLLCVSLEIPCVTVTFEIMLLSSRRSDVLSTIASDGCCSSSGWCSDACCSIWPWSSSLYLS